MSDVQYWAKADRYVPVVAEGARAALWRSELGPYNTSDDAVAAGEAQPGWVEFHVSTRYTYTSSLSRPPP
jgi:hypothetical protein